MDRHERFERGLPPMGEDLIDFPCAPCWAQHYADQGMTRAYPEGFNPDKVYHPWRYPVPPLSDSLPPLGGENIYIRDFKEPPSTPPIPDEHSTNELEQPRRVTKRDIPVTNRYKPTQTVTSQESRTDRNGA